MPAKSDRDRVSCSCDSRSLNSSCLSLTSLIVMLSALAYRSGEETRCERFGGRSDGSPEDRMDSHVAGSERNDSTIHRSSNKEPKIARLIEPNKVDQSFRKKRMTRAVKHSSSTRWQCRVFRFVKSSQNPLSTPNSVFLPTKRASRAKGGKCHTM